MTSKKRNCIFVIGMHRSGTSVMTGCLDLLGISLGSDLMDGDVYNAKGYFENKQVYKINELILKSFGQSWHSISYLPNNWSERLESLKIIQTVKEFITKEFAGEELFAIKDPRLCFLFPIWKMSMDELGISTSIIFCRREILPTINSVLRRDHFTGAKAIQIWIDHYLSLEANTRGHSRVFVNLKDLIEDPVKMIETISKGLSIDFDIREDGVAEKLRAFADLSLLHDATTIKDQLPSFFDEAQIINEHIDHIAKGREVESAFLALDKYGSHYQKSVDFFFEIHQGRVKHEVAKLDAERKVHGHEMTLLQQKLNTRRAKFESVEESLKKDLTIAVSEKRAMVEKLSAANEKLLLKEKQIHEHKRDLHTLHGELKYLSQKVHQLGEESKRELAHVKMQGDQQKRRLEFEIRDLKNSFSFRIGWFLTRPFVWPYKITKELFGGREGKIWLWWNLLLLGFSQPTRLFQMLSGQNLRVLFASMRSEHPRLILSNARKKFFDRQDPLVVTTQNVALESEKSLRDHVEMLSLPTIKVQPLVSIIVVTHNGISHLRRFSKAFKKHTIYQNYELIFVDNHSSDHSIAFLREEFPLARIIENTTNETFSRANKQGAKFSNGEYLLFANNDIAPLKGWLTHMVYEFERDTDNLVGSVGAKLVYPQSHPSSPCRLQHRGIKLNFSKDFIRPINIGQGEDPKTGNRTLRSIANTAACLLVRKQVFEEVGCFDERYIYGYEDVDLGLKLGAEGYVNICSANAYAFHHEFGTQSDSTSDEVRTRRLNNIAVLKENWGIELKERYWADVLEGTTSEYTDDRFLIGIIVTDSNPLSKAGDTYTGLELKESLEKLGWDVVLISRVNDDWNRLPAGLHCVINLLDSWCPSQAVCDNKSLLKIAWCRNWFERWSENPDFSQYDIVLTSSKRSIDLFNKKTGAPVHYFPIATNPERFTKGEYRKQLDCDYCFTGSYWKDHRQIMDFLEPSKLSGHSGSIYGYNWSGFEKFEAIYKGPIAYSEVPNVYASTRLLIDDANSATRDWGAVNSRVFDALGCGTMVITNGKRGAEDLFDGLLPTFESKAELTALVKQMLEDEEERKDLVGRLQAVVLAAHTYDHRALEIQSILRAFLKMKSLTIKVPAPSWSQVMEWGDYHMARELQKSFRKHSIRSKIQILPEWHGTTDVDSDYVLVMRGLSRYSPKRHHFNMMWNISHPDKIDLEEYETFDHVFVASKPYANEVRSKVRTPVSCLLQCTAPDVFYPAKEPVPNQLLFVGNSRKMFRRIIRDLIPTDLDLSIYGTNWQGLVDDKYIKGEHIPNAVLHRYYTGARILLNDHWDSMRAKGFISNRIFDALACGATIISDDVPGLREVFGDLVHQYRTQEELSEIIALLLLSERDEVAYRSISTLVASEHSFDRRVEEILKLTAEQRALRIAKNRNYTYAKYD